MIYCIGNKIERKQVSFEKRNECSEYFQSTIYASFPRLGGRPFKLWRMEKDKTELIPLDVENSVALCQNVELNRSCVYVKPMVCKLGMLALYFRISVLILILVTFTRYCCNS